MIKVNPDYVPKEPFIFMVSGGVDSIAAAHWLKYQYKKNFQILHFNHNVQPINDEMFDQVFHFSLDHFTDNGGARFLYRDPSDEPAFIDESEAGLRKWRHYKLEGIGGPFVTAHHINDCVESYLMNCFHGNPEHMPIPWCSFFAKNFSIFHPFLRTSKQDFIDYAEANDLMKYVVEDPTNKETKNKRNWVRNTIIPEINGRDMGIETIVRKKFYI